jgi:ubiquinone/menaquinone biosynthesis C-methylase UbiE
VILKRGDWLPVNRYYDKAVASRYDSIREWQGPVPARLAEIARINSASLLLDLGCGTGNLPQAMERICACRCIGLDLSFEMIDVANRKMPYAEFVQADCTQMPFHRECFNAVVGALFIHHVPTELRQFLINESHRVLSTGYLAIVTRSHTQIEACCYSKFFPEIIAVDKVRFPQIQQIYQYMQNTGFINIHSETVLDVPIQIDSKFLSKVLNKSISTLDIISEASFKKGVARLRAFIDDAKGADVVHDMAYTIVSGEKA